MEFTIVAIEPHEIAVRGDLTPPSIRTIYRDCGYVVL